LKEYARGYDKALENAQELVEDPGWEELSEAERLHRTLVAWKRIFDWNRSYIFFS
jgi:hypothetical protein